MWTECINQTLGTKTPVGTVILIFVREEYKTNSVIKDRGAVQWLNVKVTKAI